MLEQGYGHYSFVTEGYQCRFYEISYTMKSKLALLKCHVLLNKKMFENNCIAGYHALSGQASLWAGVKVQCWSVPLGRLSLNKDPG